MDSSGFHKKYFDSCVNFAHFTSLFVALFNCDSLLDGNSIIIGIARYAVKKLIPLKWCTVQLGERSELQTNEYVPLKSRFPRARIYICIYVTGSEKTAHFAQDFKIKLLILKGRVALKH